MKTLNPLELPIQIYSDGADRASMLEFVKNPLVKGFTTNPSLMRKAGVQNYKAYCLELLKDIPTKPISFEVFADDIENMERQAREIKTWGPNVYVKIPVTNSTGSSTLSLVKKLTNEGVQLNITAIFTPEQIKATCEALKNGAAAVVSVFAGRIADTGRDPMPIMKEARNLCENAGKKVELLWASTREPYNIIQAVEAECAIITVPPEMIKKLSAFGKDLGSASLETVQTFKKDAESSGFSL